MHTRRSQKSLHHGSFYDKGNKTYILVNYNNTLNIELIMSKSYEIKVTRKRTSTFRIEQ